MQMTGWGFSLVALLPLTLLLVLSLIFGVEVGVSMLFENLNSGILEIHYWVGWLVVLIVHVPLGMELRSHQGVSPPPTMWVQALVVWVCKWIWLLSALGSLFVIFLFLTRKIHIMIYRNLVVVSQQGKLILNTMKVLKL